MVQLGTKVAFVRKQLGFSRTNFAKLFTVSEQTIMRWERGISTPSPEQYAWLCNIEKGTQKAKEKKIDIGTITNKAITAGGAALAIYYIFSWTFYEDSNSQEFINSTSHFFH